MFVFERPPGVIKNLRITPGGTLFLQTLDDPFVHPPEDPQFSYGREVLSLYLVPF